MMTMMYDFVEYVLLVPFQVIDVGEVSWGCDRVASIIEGRYVV